MKKKELLDRIEKLEKIVLSQEEHEETLTYSIHADGKEIGKLSVSEYKELCDYINEKNKGVKK